MKKHLNWQEKLYAFQENTEKDMDQVVKEAM